VNETAGPPGRWGARELFKGALIALSVWVFFQFLWITRSLLITLFLGILFSLPLSSAAGWLQKKFGIRRGLGAVMVLLTFFGLLAGVVAMVAPTLREQSEELRTQLPRAVDRIESWIQRRDGQLKGMLKESPQAQPAAAAQGAVQANQIPPVKQSDPRTQPAAKVDQQPSQSKRSSPAENEGGGEFSLRKQLRTQLGGVLGFLFPFVSTTLAAVGAFLLVVFLALYLASDPDLYRRGFLHLVPRRHRAQTSEVLDEVGVALQQWLITRAICMVAIGGITTVTLMLLRIKAAVALGLIAGFMEFIPFFGPLISAVPALALALVDSPQKALWVAVAFLLIQQVEGNVITPLLLQKRIDIPPALTILAVSLLGLVFGFPGLLIAEPLLVAGLVTVKRTYVDTLEE